MSSTDGYSFHRITGVLPLVSVRGSTIPAERVRVERVLASGRAFLATASLVAIYFDPTQPPSHAGLTYGFLIAYIAHSLAVLTVLRDHWDVSPRLQLTIHAIDLFWAASITLLTEGPNSPFFVFFIFVLLEAAYRWGFWETFVTAAVAALLLVGQAQLLASGRPLLGLLLHQPLELDRLIMRMMYLLIFGLLLGYLAEEEKQLRSETAAIARTMAKIQTERGLSATLHAVADDVLNMFRASEALLTMRESATGRVFVWDAHRDPATSAITGLPSELPPDERGLYFFDAPTSCWHSSRRLIRAEGRTDVVTLDENGRPRHVTIVLPRDFVLRHPFRSLQCVGAEFGDEWNCRLFLFDAALGSPRAARLHFLQTLMRQIGPAVYGVYLLRRLRSRAGAIERARVARELHDGVIQSMIGIEMQLDVMRREVGEATTLADQLSHLQQLVRDEVLNLRELMQQMRPPDLKPNELLDYLASLVDRFQHETGISARFVSELPELVLPPRVCRELARIVQEALVNIRKHSEATHVLVRFAAQTGRLILVIDDDGHGFRFEGRLSQTELDAARKGPVVIKERVRAMGGDLTIESTPGHGARMEITLPQDLRG